jgi:glycosyltransferase involved in cell wall biosynthesis/2-polyprenyl-3-methyl-5-hydroxy-6-metoxy-1,4-benzoquinol methylase
VHIFATQLEAPGEYFGVEWHPAEQLGDVMSFAPPDVFVSLRMPHVFQQHIPAKLRILWTQDLLIDESVLGQLYSLDRTVFVSEYHREQWCNLQPVLRPGAWVTRNPIELGELPTEMPEKVAQRLIHISRPERGHDGLLALWPEIRRRHPEATLAVCRYSSMYDKGGWGKVCQDYDRRMQAMNAEVGGIVFLGELNKTQLYREIAQSVAMLYPTSQDGFAETNCVAATEAQACGTPIIASRRGALPETVDPHAGILIDGDVLASADVREEFYAAVDQIFELHAGDPDTYALLQRAGRSHAARSSADNVARDWERMLFETFSNRYEAHKIEVLRQLLQWDNHAHAKRVAQDIIDDWRAFWSTGDDFTIPPGRVPMLDEAREALALCDRVIKQEEQTAEHYAKYAMADAADEARQNVRMHRAAARIMDALVHAGRLQEFPNRNTETGALTGGSHYTVTGEPIRILDVSCGNGSMALVLRQLLPDAIIHGVDYSAGVIEIARGANDQFGRLARFWQGESTHEGLQYHLKKRAMEEHLADPRYDAVFCGEFIEHIEKPGELLDALEACAKPEGIVMLTTPCGPFAELLSRGIPRQRGHVHAFSMRDIRDLCAPKRNFGWEFLSIGLSPRGTQCGYWIFGFQPGGGRAGEVDYKVGILTERPYQRVTAMMIVKDGAEWLHKGLSTMWGVFDRIVIGDTGSTDESQQIAEAFGAEWHPIEWTHDFSAARNAVLAIAEPTAEWVFWVDADEHLQNPERLRWYTSDAGLFPAFAVHQRHVCADQSPFEDKPIRLFRTGRGTRFFGVVHEQPEDVMDKGVNPACDQTDFSLIHFGYEDERVRRTKMKARNLPLLMKEIAGKGQHPPRMLAWVLYIRDCANLATWEAEKTRPAKLTAKAAALARKGVEVYFRRGFDEPQHVCHKTAWPYYQQCLTLLGSGFEATWTFAAAPGRLDPRLQPKIEKFRVAAPEELQRLTSHQIDQWTKQLHPKRVDVEPFYTPAFRSTDLAAIEPFDAVDDGQLRKIVAECAPYSWGDDKRVLEWAVLFLQSLTPQLREQGRVIDPVLEIGTFKGASALMWLKLLQLIGRRVPVVTVDPYGSKPYAGGDGPARDALYTGDTFVAMKRLLAEFPDHYHFPLESQTFLATARDLAVWNAGGRVGMQRFSFALLDGEHAADTIREEVQALLLQRYTPDTRGLMAPGSLVVIDNIDADPETHSMLHELLPAFTILPAKWGQSYAVIHTDDVADGLHLQTSATSEASA